MRKRPARKQPSSPLRPEALWLQFLDGSNQGLLASSRVVRDRKACQAAAVRHDYRTHGPYLNGIARHVLQDPGKANPFRDSGCLFMPILSDIDKDGNRKVRSGEILDCTHDITHEPRSIFQGGTAIFIIAFIPDTGKKGIDLVASGAIYFHTIKSGFLSPFCSFCPNLNILFHFGKT